MADRGVYHTYKIQTAEFGISNWNFPPEIFIALGLCNTQLKNNKKTFCPHIPFPLYDKYGPAFWGLHSFLEYCKVILDLVESSRDVVPYSEIYIF